MDGDDRSAFREAMRNVKPLDPCQRVPARPRSKPCSNTRGRDGLMASHLATLDGTHVDTGEELLFRRAGISARVFKRLRRGAFSVQGELDLHGHSVSEARSALRRFISDSAGQGRGCVRVVHGKGLRSGRRGPVLKNHVNRWLRHWNEVLAFATAPSRDGGSGAVYVLLKRR